MQQLAQRLPRRSWRLRKSMRLWLREHRRSLRYAAICFALLSIVLEICQLVYPSGRILPFVTVGGQSVGGTNIASAAQELEAQYKDASLTVVTDAKKFSMPLSDAGVRPDTGAASEQAAAYAVWQRIVPFSSLVIGLTRDVAVRAQFDEQKVSALAQKVANEGRSDAVNATIEIDKAKAKLKPSVPTKEYPAKAVITAIKAAHYSPKTLVKLSPKTTPAPLTDSEVTAMLKDVQAYIDDGLKVSLDAKEHAVDAATIASWLTFTPNATASALDIGLATERVQSYLESIQGDAYKAPGITRVQLIDDREVSRTNGATGRGVSVETALPVILKAVTDANTDLAAVRMVDLPPTVQYDKTYSNADPSLASLVGGLASAKGGYGIAMMEIDGRSATANGNKQFVAASTYKLYVAYAVVREVEAGRMSWTDVISGGRTAATCFDAMIVVSDNACPKAFGDRIGWSNITVMMRELGLSSSTRLGSSMHTTANDLAYFLYRLEKGSLMSAAGRERLIDAMKRQSYTRAGIPKGAGGVVADKVGEVDGYYHDAAIVYGSKKTYILIVMTYGGSWAGIADVAAQIDATVDT